MTAAHGMAVAQSFDRLTLVIAILVVSHFLLLSVLLVRWLRDRERSEELAFRAGAGLPGEGPAGWDVPILEAVDRYHVPMRLTIAADGPRAAEEFVEDFLAPTLLERWPQFVEGVTTSGALEVDEVAT